MDIQLNGFGSLENLVSQGVPGEFINVTIAYMVTDKEWKWKALSHLLPMQEHYFGRSQRSYKGQLQDKAGVCISVTTEILWAIMTKLEMASALRIRKLVLESDLTIAWTLITQDTSRVDNNHALITIAKSLSARDREVKVQRGCREANASTNWLANFSLTKNPLDRELWMLKYPSMSLYSLLYYDFQLTPTNLILSGHGAPI